MSRVALERPVIPEPDQLLRVRKHLISLSPEHHQGACGKVLRSIIDQVEKRHAEQIKQLACGMTR